MAPQNIRRSQRHEMFVPKGTATVSDVYPKMKQFDLHTLLRLRADGALTRMIQLQGEDSEAAARLVQLAQSPMRGAMIVTTASESPDIIGVSASYDDEMSIRPGDLAISSSASRDDISPAGSPQRKDFSEGRRRSVKEIITQIHSQQDPAAKAAGMAELQKLGAVPLHGLSFETMPPPPVETGAGPTLRVQSGQFMSEVVGRLSENPVYDDDSRADSNSSRGEESTLDDDAKLYQERLNNRNNNVLVKRDAASFRVKKDGLRSAGSDRPVVSKAAAARLHTLKVKNAQNKPTGEINTIYTYDQLKNRTVEELASNPYPADVDVENREQHLKDDEFFQVFGLTKADFNGIAKWRKTEMKKKKNLY